MPAGPATWLVLSLSFIAIVFFGGCEGRPVGLGDVDIELSIEAASSPPHGIKDAALERLAAADLTAELDDGTPGTLRVRVDEALASAVSKLLTWPGGLTIAGDSHGIASAASPLLTLPTEDAKNDGPRVIVPLAPNAVATLSRTRSTETLVVLRNGSVIAGLGHDANVDGDKLVISCGRGIRAYNDAADLARLLATPRLPAMTEVSRRPLPADWLLASANVVLPFVTSLAWLFFVRRFDRAQPEPVWLVAATFAIGAVMVVPAGFVEWGWDALSPYTDATLLTFGHAPWAFPIALVGFTITVGITEEGAKLLATCALAARRREFDEPVDGIVYGGAAALGFAAAENIRYLALGRVAVPLVASRAFMSVPAHLFFGSLWGYALGRRLVSPSKPVWPLFLLAATLHGLFDACLSTDGGAPFAVLVGFAMASLFVVQLRLSLRHGAVVPSLEPPQAEGDVELFRMGSRLVFAAFVAATYVLSGALFILAILGREGRAGLTVVLASAALLALLGWAARGVAATLPLDVVVGATRVTFAGAAIAYGDILRIERSRIAGSLRKAERVIVVSAARELSLGPAPREALDALTRALGSRLAARSAPQ
jgi:protease PrsW